MSLTGFALAQAGQALIRAMSKTTHEGKGCACIAYLCTILRMFPTLLPSCELCSWLAFAALGTLPTPPLFGGTFSAAAAVRVASFPCGRSKFGFGFRNATFETRFLHFTRQAHTEKTTLPLAVLFWKIGLDMPQLAHVALPRGFQHLHNVLCTRDTPGPCRCASIGLV